METKMMEFLFSRKRAELIRSERKGNKTTTLQGKDI